jgi:hypothetical protein
MQQLIGDDPLQSSIFVLEGAHFRDIADFHAAELGLPLVERRRADAVTSAELGGVRAGLRLLAASCRGISPLSLGYYLGLRSSAASTDGS